MRAAGRGSRRGESRVWRGRITVLALAPLASLLFAGALPALPVRAASCSAQAPGAYPNDPGYSPAENGFPTTTKTWDGESWYLYGCIPQSAPLSSDPEGASGMSVDQAWATYSKGRDEVLVAYMEGGVNWRIPTSCELRLRSYLNRGELPYPENAAGKTRVDLGLGGDPYDLNGDGVFNVDDYKDDPRVTQVVAGFAKSPAGGPYLHHVCSQAVPGSSDITPEDLIVAFGNCRVTAGAIVSAFPCDRSRHYDNDGNGYANDIAGWNFNRDTNDPQTEQSIYAHFTGESAHAVGEGNNGFGGIGLCPKCRYLPIKAGDEAIDKPDRIAESIIFALHSGVKVFDGTDASLGNSPELGAAIDYAYRHGMLITWASNDFESADHTDGMLWPHVWPGNSITGDHSTRGGADCAPSGVNSAFCPFVLTNTTFRGRASLTSYGPHALFSVPNNDGSTSTGTPTQAGVAALVMSEGYNAVDAHHISSPLTPDEVKQVVRSTVSPIDFQPCPTCFPGVPGATFNIQYGYGRPNVFKADQAVDQGKIPPTADIRTPDWYQEVDPTKTPTLHVTADVAAQRAAGGAYTWELQVAPGPQPLESQFHAFASGSGTGPATVAGDLDMSQFAALAGGTYSVNTDRSSIEQYDVTVRVQVHAGGLMGEDRRAFHARHDTTEHPGFPVKLGPAGDGSPTMADIEGRGWLDTIVVTSDGHVHAFRPDGTEAPGFPVSTRPPPGMDPAYDTNYLADPVWRDNLVPRPRDSSLSAAAVGDLRHDGALEIVIGTLSGYTYAWDGAGRLLPGFPLLDGNPAYFHDTVPPPDTPYSFSPENLAGTSPVLADLTGDKHLDIIQAAGDNHVYAWHVDANGVTAVPGWPVCTIIQLTSGSTAVPGGGPGCVEQKPSNPSLVHTHDGKIVPTPAVVDINGDGVPDVVVGLDDTSWDNSGLGSTKITGYLEAFSGKGTAASATGQLPGYPVSIPGLEQGYGVAQDFVTQGVESPAVYDSASGPQAIVNANLFLPVRVNLATGAVSAPFAASTPPPSTGPGIAPSQLPGYVAGLGLPAGFSVGTGTVQFTTSASLGKVTGLPDPDAFQGGSFGADVVLGITQVPGIGVKVDNGIGGWNTATSAPTGVALPQFSQYVQGLPFFSAPAIADVNGDGVPDVIQPADSAAVMGFDGLTGQPAAPFPKWSGGFSLFTPAVGDLNGTGTVAVAAVTREGYLHVWDTPGLTTSNHEAWHWHQDDRNTGHYGTDTRPPAGIRDLSVATGSGKWTLGFTAPGDDWNSGTAAAYDVRCSATPITQDNFAQATPVDLGGARPGVAGTRESIAITPPAGAQFCAVRAIDKAGNIGPVPLAAATTNGGIPAGTNPGGMPNTARGESPAGLVLVALLLGLTAWRARRSLLRAAPPRTGDG